MSSQVCRVAVYRLPCCASYRWYDAHSEEPAFAFGHGLSYTSFSIGDLAVESPPSAGANQTVVFNVTNVGPVAGAEVAQLVRACVRVVVSCMHFSRY